LKKGHRSGPQTVRIRASTRLVPGFDLNVPEDVCLEWARRLTEQLSPQDPVSVMELRSRDGAEWHYDARVERQAAP
jgi:hypothetical protein